MYIFTIKSLFVELKKMNLMKTHFLTGMFFLLLLASCDANHTQEFNSIRKNDIAAYENFISKYPSSIHIKAARKYINEEICMRSEPLWEQWFRDNGDSFIYLFDIVSREHEKAINDFLSLFYEGPDSLRDNHHLIRWRLNEFYPLQTSTEDKFKEYLDLRQQVDSLLRFEVETDGYQIRRKSALARLMNEFLLNVYENKLIESIEDPGLLALLEQERESWSLYCESTSNAFGKIVLGRFQYNLKATFWNNYDFDIMNQRLKSLVYLYSKDVSALGDNMCGWNDVVEGFDNVRKDIKSDSDSEFGYSYDEKVAALEEDKKAFNEYTRVHANLLEEMGISGDEGHLLYLKAQTLNRFMDYYNDVVIRTYD